MKESLRNRVRYSWVGRLLNRTVSRLELGILDYYKEKKIIRLIKEIMKEDRHFLFRPSEVFMVYSLSRYFRGLEGDYAEVGVFMGSSAKAICEAKGDHHLHLFDTFEGLPGVDSVDTRFRQEMFQGCDHTVRKRLSGYPDVHIHKGVFPRTVDPVKDKKFAFVHLDVDLYRSTLDCLEFFYPRMVEGGGILSHDYAQAHGVKSAFDEFFTDKPEHILELPMTQCLVIKQ